MKTWNFTNYASHMLMWCFYLGGYDLSMDVGWCFRGSPDMLLLGPFGKWGTTGFSKRQTPSENI